MCVCIERERERDARTHTHARDEARQDEVVMQIIKVHPINFISNY